MRVLVTGAAGFLGSHLVDRFLAAGHRVIGMDNQLTGNPANLAHVANNPNFEFHRQDVTTFIAVDGALDRPWQLSLWLLLCGWSRFQRDCDHQSWVPSHGLEFTG